ncbi:MAG TPA: multicopper oxidase domain-containing protein [Gemmatimonadaceae bacterium]|nr:multicopper oxidase domain-containing protein [Gemmatimonadaceae bacterium]
MLILSLCPIPAAAQLASHERVAANDNRVAAGTLKNGVLDLTLDIRNGMWYPEADNGATVPIQAFAEAGRAPSTPGPLIRVPEGTEVRITLRNTLTDSVRVLGLDTRPAPSGDGIVVQSRGTRNVRFVAGAPGTYYYWGTTADNPLTDRKAVESQLSGAFIIDPRSGSGSPRDRVFVLGIWFDEAKKVNGVELPEREVLVINGKSWPHTERFTFTVGDTVRWRWVNPTGSTHPMHLHGFYYSVNSRGMMSADTIYRMAERRLVNTELMRVGSTMAFTWVPEKPGNWIFHCHFAFHVSDENVLEPKAKPAGGKAAEHAEHRAHAMAGLVLGIHVNPRPGDKYAVSTEPPRRLRLLLQTAPKRFGDKPAIGFVLQDGDKEPKRDSVSMPGPTLFLKRGQPVRITVVNHLREPSAVHWHGIELESFPDGVPNWSGMGKNVMAPIAPGDSFIAAFTPPRSGTFMYHSHLNEGTQMNSGMYGALLVLDDPRKFDPEKDKIILVGGGGPEPGPGLDTRGFVNGSSDPEPLLLEAGTKYRIRVINIHPDWRVEFALGTDSTRAQWRPVAKDGADLPKSQMTPRAAYLLTGPGETADFEFTPMIPGAMRLEVKTRVAGWNVPVDVFIRAAKQAAIVP